jgi:molybdopterin synthase catalytic subunit
MQCAISNTPLVPEACRRFVETDAAGAHVLFTGAVRNHSKGSEVTHLVYEAYEPMALKQMQAIANQAQSRWPLHKVCVHHRVGELAIGDLAVVVAVSASHRAEAFAACAWIIDELKREVPIWKREFTADGDEWISDRP